MWPGWQDLDLIARVAHAAPIESPRPRSQIVRFQALPSRAEVWLDGEKLGRKSDSQAWVPLGRHVVELRLGGESRWFVIDVKGQRAITVRANFH